MQGGGARPSDGEASPGAGEQFPPLANLPIPGEAEAGAGMPATQADAMQRLADRQASSGDAGNSKVEGFESSIHKIKEQVLPRLLERVDPEAAATLDKNELAEEFRPIIGEVLAELKLTLNRREQFALEKVLVDELLGLGPLEELLADPNITDIMVNGPEQTYVERKGKLELAQIQFRDEEHPVPDRAAHLQLGRPPRRPDHAISRRPSQGRVSRQRHRAAAVAARHSDLDS